MRGCAGCCESSTVPALTSLTLRGISLEAAACSPAENDTHIIAPVKTCSNGLLLGQALFSGTFHPAGL